MPAAKKKKPAPRNEGLARFGLKNYDHPDRFGQLIGYKVERVDRRKLVAETSLRIREAHLSPANKVHGGVISAFLDYACGAAVFLTMGALDFASTVEIKVNYLRPILLGDRLKARTEVVFRGKKLCVTYGFVYRNGEKAPAAMVTATYNVVRAG